MGEEDMIIVTLKKLTLSLSKKSTVITFKTNRRDITMLHAGNSLVTHDNFRIRWIILKSKGNKIMLTSISMSLNCNIFFKCKNLNYSAFLVQNKKWAQQVILKAGFCKYYNIYIYTHFLFPFNWTP